jgi:hypothetical protein
LRKEFERVISLEMAARLVREVRAKLDAAATGEAQGNERQGSTALVDGQPAAGEALG